MGQSIGYYATKIVRGAITLCRGSLGEILYKLAGAHYQIDNRD